MVFDILAQHWATLDLILPALFFIRVFILKEFNVKYISFLLLSDLYDLQAGNSPA